ncbi:MAG TPA: hypothetical protein PKJ79_13530 [Quisquiliibacterium sp.]|nr:hypothetical protein [Quisquiliibacterium sp.]
MTHSERLLEASHAVAAGRRAVAADPELSRWVHEVKRWQSARLARTHADLLETPRYRDAARFFLEDLYGAKDFSQRDAELLRVIPTLTRLLPDAALATLADAVELDALSERLDAALATALRPGAAAPLTEADYARAYRASAARTEREHQLDLVLMVGRSLDRLVRHPLIGRLLSAMGGPARLAGLSAMHQFLVDGFEAFRRIGGASDFLRRIDARERLILGRLFDGVDSDWTVPPVS